MRFEAIAGVRPSLGRAPVYTTPFASLPPPLESPWLARLEEAWKKSPVGEGKACATRQAASREEICARFQSQKKCGQKARQLRTVVAKCFEKHPPPALVPHSPPRASHQRKRPVDRVTSPALARKLSRDRLRIHPKRTTPCLVPPPPPCSWPSRSASPPPAFRRSNTSCTARGPPTPASSSEGHGPDGGALAHARHHDLPSRRYVRRAPASPLCSRRVASLFPEKVTRKNLTFFPRARRPNRSPPPLPMSSSSQAPHRHVRFHRQRLRRRPLQPLRLGRHPFDAADYAAANAVHTESIQVPFVIGGIGFLHSVPAARRHRSRRVPVGEDLQTRHHPLNHADIVALNPNLASLDQPITVARRVEGSSSTNPSPSTSTRSAPTSGSRLPRWSAKSPAPPPRPRAA